MSLVDLPKLVNLHGLEGLKRMGTLTSFDPNGFVYDALSIGWNDNLVSLEGLSGLTSINGALSIYTNALLPNFRGLERITYIATVLGVSNNAGLTSLMGLEGLSRVGLVDIESCPALTSLHALASVSTLDDGLAIRSNTALATCEAQWFAGHVAMFNGDKDISANDDAGICH